MRRRKLPGLAKGRIRIILVGLVLALAASRLILRRDVSPSPALEPCERQLGCFRGIVTRIVDGDTLDISGTRIRLVLVDAPERSQRGGLAAARRLRELCPVGSEAMIHQDRLQRKDDYGRMLAVVWCGGHRANEEMIRSGHAALYRRFCRRSEFGQQPWAVALGCP